MKETGDLVLTSPSALEWPLGIRQQRLFSDLRTSWLPTVCRWGRDDNDDDDDPPPCPAVIAPMPRLPPSGAEAELQAA